MADETTEWNENPALITLVVLISLMCFCSCICLCCGQWLIKQMQAIFKYMVRAVRDCCKMADVSDVVNEEESDTRPLKEKTNDAKPDDAEPAKAPANEGRQPGGRRLWWDLCGCCEGDIVGAKAHAGEAPPVQQGTTVVDAKSAVLLSSLPSAIVVRPIRKAVPRQNVDYALDYGVAIPLLPI